MKTTLFNKCVGLLLLVPAVLQAQENRPEKPNVLVLLTDDLGWQDVDCYDIDEPNAYMTPNIDALAKKGVQFWRAYSPAPTCAPSRCAIVSGVHPARAQKTHIKGGSPPKPSVKDARMLSPWFSARTPVGDYTIASAMKDHGYVTGHVGKWHISYSEPKATELGFDVSYGSRVSKALMKDRLKDFATNGEDDPYKLDENGFPFNQTTENALKFLDDNKAKPFFLYYATWLVHAPIQTRSKQLLEKYAEEMGIDPADRKSFSGSSTGQVNPFYGAMVEELDYNIGRVFDYLEHTDDPRWPGHKLIENTYIIFISDNGGTEGKSYERYTDNTPLDLGKTSVKEGGIRVPFIVTGPDVPAGVETDVLANGLDIYPTVLSMVGAQQPEKRLDGLDLFQLLTNDPTDSSLVKDNNGEPRKEMMWHFPHDALESALIDGDFKLVKNYDFVKNPKQKEFELYQLYESKDGKKQRVDIEESKNLADSMPEKVRAMDAKLKAQLTEMKASYPHYNPDYPGGLPHKESVPTVSEHKIEGEELTVSFKENGAKVAQAQLIYTIMKANSGYQEWFPEPMSVKGGRAAVKLPKGTRYFYVNLIDENNFLVSYPKISAKESKDKAKKKSSLSEQAISVK
ncbi:sulfatase [Rubritalea spongiae]|uniref:Sulfatase n=1 Tax=Rubritalea spongiae TaxID=430797 RepID=A0ABW5E7B9_9BACT